MSLSNGSRKFMRYSYGDLLRDDRKYGVLFRMWPGSMKLLMWGDPEMAAAWGRYAGFCGSLGMEIQEPLSFKGKQGSGLPGGRNAYQDAKLKPAADWEKWAYTYRLWGRLQYNPDTDAEVWRRMLRTRWQAAAPAAEAALAHSSRILPLITTAHLPSAANANYWPEIYTNMSISDPTVKSPYSDTPEPKRFGTVSPLDPEMFCAIDEYASEILGKECSGKYSPLLVILWLDYLVEVAEKQFAILNLLPAFKNIPDLQRVANDVKIQIGIGKFFSKKINSAFRFAMNDFRTSANLYREARDAWAEIAMLPDSVYVHDITFGEGKQLRGCWAERLKAIDDDIDRIEKLRDATKTPPVENKLDMKSYEQAVRLSGRLSPQHMQAEAEHIPPKSYRPAQDILISIKIDDDPHASYPINAARLHYRHINQAEKYETVDLKPDGNRWTASIPAAYTNSPFPLQYFFRLHGTEGVAWHYPQLGPSMCNQPYFVVRKA